MKGWFLPRLARILRSLAMKGRWTGKRFTPAGKMLLFGYGISLLYIADTRKTLNFQLFALLLSLLSIAIAAAVLAKNRFEIIRNLPRYGSAGTELRYELTVRNPDERSKRITLFDSLELPGQDDSVTAEDCPAKGLRARLSFLISALRGPYRNVLFKDKRIEVGPGGEVKVEMSLTPLVRGGLRLDQTTAASPDPLGLFYGFSHSGRPQSVIILPKRYPLPPIHLPGGRKYQPGGVSMAGSVGDSQEFVGLRDYRRGDPLRHIHWRSWAKLGKPVVKEHQEEFFLRHGLILDTFLPPGGMSSELFEAAVSVAASFAAAPKSLDSLLDLLFVGAKAHLFTSGRGLAMAENMLEVLATVTPCASKPFSSLTRMVYAHSALMSGCALILLTWDEERKSLARGLAARGIKPLVLVIAESGVTELEPDPLNPRLIRVDQVGRDLAGL